MRPSDVYSYTMRYGACLTNKFSLGAGSGHLWQNRQPWRAQRSGDGTLKEPDASPRLCRLPAAAGKRIADIRRSRNLGHDSSPARLVAAHLIETLTVSGERGIGFRSRSEARDRRRSIPVQPAERRVFHPCAGAGCGREQREGRLPPPRRRPQLSPGASFAAPPCSCRARRRRGWGSG